MLTAWSLLDAQDAQLPTTRKFRNIFKNLLMQGINPQTNAKTYAAGTKVVYKNTFESRGSDHFGSLSLFQLNYGDTV